MSKNRFYPDEDINDIIEAEEGEFFKGGVGSGKRGHTTNRPSGGIRMNNSMQKWAEPKVMAAMNKMILADMNGTAPTDKQCQAVADMMHNMTAGQVKERVKKISAAQQAKHHDIG